MPGHEQVKAERVPAADLEPIERRERIVHRAQRTDHALGFASTTECANAVGNTKAILKHSPHDVLERSTGGIECFVGHIEFGDVAVRLS